MLFNQGRAGKLCTSFFFFCLLAASSQGHTVSAVGVRGEMMRSSQGCKHLRQKHIYTSFCTAVLLATLHCKSKCKVKFPRAEVVNHAEFQPRFGKNTRTSPNHYYYFLAFHLQVVCETPDLPTAIPFSGLELSRCSLSRLQRSPSGWTERERANPCGGHEAAKASSTFRSPNGSEAERHGGKRYSWRVSEQKR